HCETLRGIASTLPSRSCNDVSYCRCADIKHVPNHLVTELSRVPKHPYGTGLVSIQLCLRMTLSEVLRPVQHPVRCVLFLSPVDQVRSTTVRLAPVQMPDLQAFGARPDERLSNQAVYRFTALLPLQVSEVDHLIASGLVGCCGHDPRSLTPARVSAVPPTPHPAVTRYLVPAAEGLVGPPLLFLFAHRSS